MNVILGMMKKKKWWNFHSFHQISFLAMMCVKNKINNSEGKIKRNNVDDKHDVQLICFVLKHYDIDFKCKGQTEHI